MCGISGIVARSPIALQRLKEMTELISYRGPDGQGFLILGEHDGGLGPGTFAVRPQVGTCHVGLGHRRLSIIDLSDDGLQPFVIGEHVLVFNGEVYNYVELKAELRELGHRFRTHTDTEVALTAFIEWGEAALERMRGMWAMAWVDEKNARLTLIRDRFGIKPLYYTYRDGVLAFGSEAKQLLAQLPHPPALDVGCAVDFLSYGITDHTEKTFFRDVLELPAGQLCRFDLRTGHPVTTKAWYTPQPAALEGTREELIAGFRRRFDESITEHLRADVPLGSCLSGGLDSSSIVASVYLRRTAQSPQQLTFSFVPREARFSEEKFIERVLTGKDIKAVRITPEASGLLSQLDDLIFHQDFPFSSTSIFAQREVFRAAQSAGVKIMLDGQGADEVLGGYHSFLKMHLYSLFASGNVAGLRAQLRDLGPHGHGIKFGLQSILLGALPESLERSLRRLTGTDGSESYFSHTPGRNPRSYRGNGVRDMRTLSLDQITRSNLPMLLRYEDRNSMAQSIEARVPFLDHRLVEYALGLPDDLRVKGPETKSVLREAMRERLPPQITHRLDKMGFVSPEEVWMKEAGDRVLELLTELQRECAPLVKPKLVRDFQAFLRGARGYDQVYWRVLCFGLWRRRFNVQLP